MSELDERDAGFALDMKAYADMRGLTYHDMYERMLEFVLLGYLANSKMSDKEFLAMIQEHIIQYREEIEEVDKIIKEINGETE